MLLVLLDPSDRFFSRDSRTRGFAALLQPQLESYSTRVSAMASNLDHNVTLSDGPIRGIPRDDSGVLAFKGIPYAAPPVGDLRWRSPQPPNRWSDVRDVTQFGHSALSSVPRPAATEKSEDCLTLNVWTAAAQADEARPVMLWIHGGGFQFGSSASPLYDGARLAQRGVVLVSFNYRLAVFGFLALDELDGEGGTASGNFGLQDQLVALRWVRQNIASFGGDAGNVTLFGESSGAHAIGLLMGSPLSSGLFDKTILQSGAYWDSHHGPLASPQEARSHGARFASKLGAKSVADLRKVPAADLIKASPWSFVANPATQAFSPSIDAFVVPQIAARTFGQGKQADVPVLAGWNAAEFLPFVRMAMPHGSAGEFREAARLRFRERADEFLGLYPGETDEQAAASAKALIGDLIISEQTWELADTHSRTGHSPVYAYYYSYTSSYSPMAGHTADLDFVFGNLGKSESFIPRGGPEDGDRSFSDAVMAYWTNFAKKSDPNDPATAKNAGEWPAYDCDKPVLMGLGRTIKQTDYPLERFRFLRSLRVDGEMPLHWRDLDVGQAEQPGPK